MNVSRNCSTEEFLSHVVGTYEFIILIQNILPLFGAEGTHSSPSRWTVAKEMNIYWDISTEVILSHVVTTNLFFDLKIYKVCLKARTVVLHRERSLM